MSDVEKTLLILAIGVGAYILLAPAPKAMASPNNYSSNVPFYMSYNTPSAAGYSLSTYTSGGALPVNFIGEDGISVSDRNTCTICQLFSNSSGGQF